MSSSYTSEEEKRLQALREHQILDTPPEPAFDRTVHAARDICQTPIALISLVDETRQWFKAKVGMEASETPRDISFCAHAIQQSTALIIPDAQADERFSKNPLVVADPKIRFYAGVPLRTPDGYALGTLCVIDYKPRQLTPDQIHALESLARQTSVDLQRRRAITRLLQKPFPQKRSRFFSQLTRRLGLAIVIILALEGASRWSEAQSLSREQWVTHTLEVQSNLESVGSDLADLQLAIQASIIRGQKPSIAIPGPSSEAIHLELSKLKELTADNAYQQDNLNVLELLIDAELTTLKQIISVQPENRDLAIQLLTAASRNTNRAKIRQYLGQMRQEEEQLLQQRLTLAKSSRQLDSVLSIAGTLAVLAIVVTTYRLIQREIQKRVQAENEKDQQRELLEVTLSSIGDAVITTDSNQRVTFLNPVAEVLTGWTHQEAEGHSVDYIFKMVNLITGDPIKPPFEVTLTEGIVQGLDSNTGMKNRNGSIIPIDDSCAPILSKEGHLEGAVMVFRDITERKQFETELQRALVQEKELSELKSSFISMISHDIRTPLTIILSSIDLLQSYAAKATEEKKQQYFKQIRSSVQRMQDLLNDVLLVSRAESGGIKYEPVPLELTQFCQSLVEEIQVIAGDKHEIVFTQSHACLDVYMDANLLQHIFTNLLSNAVKYSPQGGKIEFELDCQNESAIFRVRDHGIGIPEEYFPNLFTTFSRADNVGSISGTGLGLSIVRTCVERQSGKINVVSKVGEGTTFEVILPLNPVGQT